MEHRAKLKFYVNNKKCMEYSQFSGHVQIIFQMKFFQKQRKKNYGIHKESGINTHSLKERIIAETCNVCVTVKYSNEKVSKCM